MYYLNVVLFKSILFIDSCEIWFYSYNIWIGRGRTSDLCKLWVQCATDFTAWMINHFSTNQLINLMKNNMNDEWFLFQGASSIENIADSFGALYTLTVDNAQNVEFVQSWLCVRLVPILPYITKEFLSNMSKINFSCVTYQKMYDLDYCTSTPTCWNCGW